MKKVISYRHFKNPTKPYKPTVKSDNVKNSIQFKIICITLFTLQSLQSNFTGYYVSKIDLYCNYSIKI